MSKSESAADGCTEGLEGGSRVLWGGFTDYSRYPDAGHSATARDVPVLRGAFDASRFEFDPELPLYFGWGVMPVADTVALSFRLQLGPNALYWIANAADPCVWHVVDQWAAEGAMALAVELDGLPAMVVQRNFYMSPELEAVRETAGGESQVRDFIADVTHGLLTDELRHAVASDIPQYSELQHIQGCLVRTPVTGG